MLSYIVPSKILILCSTQDIDFDLVKDRISKSLEELNVQSQFQNFQELYSILKKSKVKYRFLLENSDISRVFRKNYKKSYVKVYSFA